METHDESTLAIVESHKNAAAEHQEAAAAGADEFSAEGAVGHGVIIPIVDDGVAHAGAADGHPPHLMPHNQNCAVC